MTANVLLIACGALAREIVELIRLNDWDHVRVQCLPAELHNRPESIPEAVRTEIDANRDAFQHIFVAYADCGTGGRLDSLLEEYGVERLPGAHCYEFFAGTSEFKQLAETNPGTFYLTDFLTRHFDRLVRRGLGLDRHPELMQQYFGNYERLLYLAQTESPELESLARKHAAWLGLDYEYVFTGLDRVNRKLTENIVRWRN
jgi:hypothetical protein